jgi:outer membrane protein W
MKKISLIILTIAVASFFSVQKSASGQAVEQGNVIIDAYYGFPNLWATSLNTTYVGSGTNVETSSLGPLGGRVEYMLSDNFGLGIDFLYASNSVSYTDNTYNYKVSVNRPRVLPRFNYHFGNSDALDLYGVLGIGWNGTKYVFESNDPSENLSFDALVPVAFRLGFGMRYFFTDNIGANMELGFGGAAVTAGLSVKF